MTAYAILKNDSELLSMFKSEESASDQLHFIRDNRKNADSYALKQINISGNNIKNSIVYSIFKDSNKSSIYCDTFSNRKDAENKLKTYNKDLIYVDIYYIEEHPIFD